MSSINEISELANQWSDPSTATKFAISERATAPFAKLMLQKTHLTHPEGKVNILDFACGTGAVTAAAYAAIPKENWGNVKILGTDVSQPMLDFLKFRGEKAGWSGLETKIVDGRDITLPKETHTHLFINFAVFALPPSTVPACAALLQPGGRIGVSSWKYAGWHTIVERAVARLSNPPTVPSYDQLFDVIHDGRAWDTPEYVTQTLEDAGFIDVDVVIQKERVDCGTPEQFADTMFMLMGLIASFWEENKRADLTQKVLRELKKVVEEEIGRDGRFVLEFEGIVGVGRKPE
ncbi:S-adenosyl-L-methionine-dependent methyltransferase [Massarina eburnea CBS 473.64]|uniref:S-adenosyl-L-methionine-dependent methyltransferase n=1 Tax=Massarina eburnea CBS 473.64 TaxID=1395130 RepID=A0A6A6SA02_9PLEO|nr:S-adenosyl-L-methionine-dependent methyltransferase [Massarina eburnea CBS 473.64]